jgi:hypothetical protein
VKDYIRLWREQAGERVAGAIAAVRQTYRGRHLSLFALAALACLSCLHMVGSYQGAADPPANEVPSIYVNAHGNGSGTNSLFARIVLTTNGCRNPVRIEYQGYVEAIEESNVPEGYRDNFSLVVSDPTRTSRSATLTRDGSIRTTGRSDDPDGVAFELDSLAGTSGSFTLRFSADWARPRGYRSCYLLIPRSTIEAMDVHYEEQSPVRGSSAEILVEPLDGTIPLILSPFETYPRLDDPFAGTWRCRLVVHTAGAYEKPWYQHQPTPCPGGYAAASEPGAPSGAVRGGVFWGTALGVALAFAAQILLDPLLGGRRKEGRH